MSQKTNENDVYESDFVEFKIKNLKIKHKMSDDLIKLSKSKDFMSALSEWVLLATISIDNIPNDDKYTTRCLCHSKLKKNAYILHNVNTDFRIFVGKTCYSRFNFTPIDDTKKSKLMNMDSVKLGNDFKLINNMKTSNMLIQRQCKITNTCTKAFDKLGCDTLSFGKYKGQSIYKLALTKVGRKYLYWVISDSCKIYVKMDYSNYAFTD